MAVCVPRKYRKLFQDAIVVNIPLDVTADLGVAIKRTRAKRIEELYRHFPSLQKEKKMKTKTKTTTTRKDDRIVKMDDDDEEDEDEVLPKKNKKQKPNLHQPLREQYGSVVDYLEAKYVMGVTVPSSGGEEEEEEEEEDRGSVYSDGSFLDDTQLKSELAEQVLSQKTQTKVSVENEDDHDNEFFVNVGNLEVEEEHDLMEYDPLQEENEEKQQVKKRKRSTDASRSSAKSTTSKTSGAKKPKMTDSSSNKSAISNKKALPKSANKPKEDDDDDDDDDKEERSEESQGRLAVLKQETVDKQDVARALYDRIVRRIASMSDEELPRRKKTSKVSVIVSDGKEPGDTITFENPHIPGQRLQVKVPKGLSAGSKFIVSVPAPVVPDEADSNKWDREFQELLADFAATYDEWCHAEVEYREAAPDIKEKFPLKKKKFDKFEELVKEFPSDLVTPVDSAYLKHVARRARQNKQKRVKTAGGSPATAIPKQKTEPKKKETVEPPKEKVSETVEIKVPGKGCMFPKGVLKPSEFEA